MSENLKQLYTTELPKDGRKHGYHFILRLVPHGGTYVDHGHTIHIRQLLLHTCFICIVLIISIRPQRTHHFFILYLLKWYRKQEKKFIRKKYARLSAVNSVHIRCLLLRADHCIYWLLTHTYRESNQGSYPFGLNTLSILFWSFCILVPRNHQMTRKRSPQSFCRHVHLRMMSCLSVLMLTMSLGKFEFLARNGRSISATRCQHLMVVDLDGMYARIPSYI